jgi:hypothetical protein
VAAAINILARAILKGKHVAGIPATSEKAADVIRGNLLSDKGIGYRLVAGFLATVPGMNSNIVQEQIANLKASGDYQLISKEEWSQPVCRL